MKMDLLASTLGLLTRLVQDQRMSVKLPFSGNTIRDICCIFATYSA